ncbi:hypothetical protein NNO_1534 [Hydrogenimonas sp.]|nr:hypothetical protein NNO_1534 [Hydrogenimonas sp.]
MFDFGPFVMTGHKLLFLQSFRPIIASMEYNFGKFIPAGRQKRFLR